MCWDILFLRIFFKKIIKSWPFRLFLFFLGTLKMFSSLRARMVAACMAISIISLMILAAVTFYIVRSDTLATFNKDTDISLNGYADEISAWFDARRRFAHLAAMAPGLEDPMPLLHRIREAGDFHNAFFTRVDKKTYSVADIPADYDGTQRPWFKIGAQASGAILTPARVDAFTKKLIVGAVEPVKDAQGQLFAVAVVDIGLDTISQIVRSITPHPNSFTFLVGDENKIVAYSNPDLLFKPASDIHEIFSPDNISKVATENFHPKIDFNGQTFFIYGKQIKNTAYTLVLAVPEAEVLKPVEKLSLISILVTLACAATAAVVLLVFIRSQLAPLVQARDALQDIANGEGDLTRRIQVRGHDELAEIGNAFNTFADKIAAILRNIRNTADTVRTQAAHIAEGNASLATHIQAQAGAIEQTSNVMDTLTHTVQQNADNAAQANTVGDQAADVATRANTAVQQVVDTMGAISQSSNKIKDIISVIDGIAFQTNILALNAAVEAARAGEQGRGFAVVAAEVRSLAQRSATAAKEIKDLIETSVAQAQSGSQIVGDAGVVMDQVVNRIGNVASLVSEITHASRDQSAGIAQVGQTVDEMQRRVSDNLALIEQSRQATQELAAQADTLAAMVAAFKLEHGSSAAAPHTLRLR